MVDPFVPQQDAHRREAVPMRLVSGRVFPEVRVGQTQAYALREKALAVRRVRQDFRAKIPPEAPLASPYRRATLRMQPLSSHIFQPVRFYLPHAGAHRRKAVRVWCVRLEIPEE
ncbi:hypothetical protein HPB51_003878 [Rhipicephalus microplus]|uniref:Uncharacterized protein n=1 Tax=Rhipicephalus microplus TaxID=6941 RepID=A0A9J6ELN1_RHIMP|nr:hypothetical protein HPB51_003878 [Rhipicephalus microplus]